MSDTEEGGKKGGYRLEYAGSARAKCKGPKPCAGTPIGKGELRVGSTVDFRGNTTFAWRHWGCVTAKVISNMKKSFEDADELDGFDELRDEDKEKIRTAWEVGHVADEDIPESARKKDEDGDEEEGEGEEGEKPKKKKAPAKAPKKDTSNEPGVFKLEYSSSGRAKCKGCGDSIGKDYFRIGQEVDFRGNKSLYVCADSSSVKPEPLQVHGSQFLHWGCLPNEALAKLKKSYSEPSAIEGFSELKEAEQDKVKRAWEADEIPEDDKGPGEPVVDAAKKKAPAKRAKKDEDGEPPKKRVRKAAKKAKDEDEDEDHEEEEEEKPKKKRAPPKKSEKKAPAKKRAPAKKDESESGEDFGDEIDAVEEEDEELEEEEESEDAGKKRKRAAPKAKAKAPSSKSASKSAKPTSSRRKQRVAQYTDDEDDE
ncbi:hypothetical protein NM688_g7039 [Phlebia brevispora]|uniref:Uncharacterized protein n=1 Tax=Phlebia brevispora TaxID=194682 RepID=A0ACC1S9L7_9APHY|nr:hypothetical protein NM688_g7039 [Phlebia brevispora]